MTFWGGSRLAKDGKAGHFVEPFDSGRIDCSAYELTLGSEAYVTPKHGDDPCDNVKERLDPARTEEIGGKLCTVGGGTVVIPPGQFALLLTEEKVALPATVMGFISLKSDPKFRGLINVSGFHVDPGFSGRLIFSVYNAGPSAIHLDRGDRLFQLWIADLSGENLEQYQREKSGYADIPSDLISKVSRERHSLQALSDRVDGLSFQVRLYTSVAAGIATALALFGTLQKLGWLESASTPLVEASAKAEQVPARQHSGAILVPSPPPPMASPNPPTPTGN